MEGYLTCDLKRKGVWRVAMKPKAARSISESIALLILISISTLLFFFNLLVNFFYYLSSTSLELFI